MSAAQLVQVLENELGWRPAKDRKKLQAADFEWMFISDDANKAFLSWICNHVTKRNVLSTEELQELEEIKASGHYLQGKELEEALQRANVDQTLTSEAAVSELRAEVESLESTYISKKEEVSDLLRQREHLVAQLAAVKSRTQSLQRVQQRRQESFSRVTMAKADQRNSSINHLLEDLSSAASLVAGCYGPDENRTLKESFVTSIDITTYLDQEETCLQQSQQFVKRRLASQTAVGDLSDSALVHSDSLDKGEDDLLQDPSLAFLRGVDAETHARHCREMARLQNAYSLSEKDKLDAEIELARARAAFETTKMQMMREQYYQSMDEASVKSKVMEYKSQIVKDRQLLKRQLDQHIPELILQVAQLQSAPILWGDYNLKIARQRYKQHKIQKAISTLLAQQARISMLAFAQNAEASEFKLDVASLMGSCVRELLQWKTDTKTRQRRMEERLPSKRQAVNMSGFVDKQSVDLADKSSLAFIRLLRLALPNAAADGADAIELAHRLIENLTSMRHQRDLSSSTEEEVFSRSRQAAKLLVEKLFGASTTSTTATLTPPAVSQGQQKLEAAIQELSTAMETVIREHQQKQQEISSLPKDRLIERQLWVAFFTNPSSLQRLFRDILSK